MSSVHRGTTVTWRLNSWNQKQWQNKLVHQRNSLTEHAPLVEGLEILCITLVICGTFIISSQKTSAATDDTIHWRVATTAKTWSPPIPPAPREFCRPRPSSQAALSIPWKSICASFRAKRPGLCSPPFPIILFHMLPCSNSDASESSASHTCAPVSCACLLLL